MNVLQLCSYYVGSDLYERLFDKLNGDISNIVYVPCKKSSVEMIESRRNTSELVISPIFRESNKLIYRLKNILERFLFYGHNDEIYKDMLDKIDLDKIDVVHAHSLFSNGYLAYKLNQQYNIDYVVAVRNTDINFFYKYAKHLNKISEKILIQAKYIIFISNAYKNLFLNKLVNKRLRVELIEKIIVIPNGIDDFWLSNKNLKSIKKKPVINIIYVGRIDNNKNIKTTIKALNYMKKKNSKLSIKYTIVGEGKLNKECKRLISNTKNTIDIVGYKEKSEILKLYNEHDIFIMPSKYETFGLVYVEAMTQGLPIIYTREQGFDKFFYEGEVGFSVNYNSYKEIGAKINQIYSDYHTISERCICNSNQFNWSEIANKYKKIYGDIKYDKFNK